MNRKPKTRRWNGVLALVYIVLATSVLANLVITGSVPSLPRAGPALSEAISRQTWDLHLYQQLGSRLNALTGLTGLGVDVLTQALGPGLAQIEGNVSGALLHYTERSYSTLHTLLHWLRWTPPLSLLVALILTLLRPREVHTFGR
jgi:hypothetical protein